MRALLLLRLDLSGTSAVEESIHPVDPREPIVRATDLGVLPGTTQADAFSGITDTPTRIGVLMRDDLDRADALWLCSRTRGAVPVRQLDRAERFIHHDLTARMNAALDARED